MKRCPGIPLISPSKGLLLPEKGMTNRILLRNLTLYLTCLISASRTCCSSSIAESSFYHFISVFGINLEQTGLHLLPPCQLANVWDLAPALLMPILRAESSVRQSSDSANRSTVYSPPTHFLFTKSQRKGKHKFLWGRESKTLLHKRHIYYLQHYIFKIFWFFYK